MIVDGINQQRATSDQKPVTRNMNHTKEEIAKLTHTVRCAG